MSEPLCPQKAPYVKEEAAGTKAWCSCGHSKNQPYCDGSHGRENTGMRPVVFNFTEPKKVAWCGCKKTKTPPFCDGTHKTLP
ncbi:MAG: CDGSH iron-sulfur domain-containing protein [Elusimicrobia bacterium]|nr:CDGSH iron-sulfur domain-containing protein [Elusimicrobiota bacterium]